MSEAETQRLDLGGIVINSGLWRAQKPCGKRPILFCNGIGANLELIQSFSEQVHDRDVLTFDAPGVGESATTALPYRLWKLARWIKRLVEAYDYDEVDIVGLSWGGTLAQQLAFQYPSLVKKLVLVATIPGFIMVPGKLKSLTKMMSVKRYSDQAFLEANFEMLYGETYDEVGEAYTSRVKPPTVRGYIYQLMALMGWTSLPLLPLISQPTLILMGENDHIVPSVNGRIISAFARDAAYSKVEEGGHLFLVTKAETVVPDLLGFLDGADPKQVA